MRRKTAQRPSGPQIVFSLSEAAPEENAIYRAWALNNRRSARVAMATLRTL
jgi:hypothetical protein